MTLLMGYNEGEDRLRRETLKPAPRVAIDHDFYTNNYEAARFKRREVEHAIKAHTGDDVGYEGREKRKYAIGGAVKERRGFFE